MKVVALISGGKDSTFNMIKCVEAGHEIVALAHLYPPNGGELDSYMYQSVGSNVIEAYAACMGLPLYRRPIEGRPVNVAYEYEATAEDEVEGLFDLLVAVRAAHPDVQGVSSGAILSTYQKNRVENVCGRLGLTSLAYLWGADQHRLLQEMVDAKLDAILIKVAVYGLGEGDLGRRLEEMQPKLEALSAKHGINVCGEGGEYESLTLDCALFRHQRIVVEGSVVQHHTLANDIVQVCYLDQIRWRLEGKGE